MNESLPSHLLQRSAEAAQARLALRLAAALTEFQAVSDRPDIDARLRFAREQALARCTPGTPDHRAGRCQQRGRRRCRRWRARQDALVVAPGLAGAAGRVAGRAGADRQALHPLADRSRRRDRCSDPRRRPAARGLPRPWICRVPQDRSAVIDPAPAAYPRTVRRLCLALVLACAGVAGNVHGQTAGRAGSGRLAKLSPAQRSVLTPLERDWNAYHPRAAAEVGRTGQPLPRPAGRRAQPRPAAHCRLVASDAAAARVSAAELPGSAPAQPGGAPATVGCLPRAAHRPAPRTGRARRAGRAPPRPPLAAATPASSRAS